MRLRLSAVAFLATCLLAACGGGGGGALPPATSPTVAPSLGPTPVPTPLALSTAPVIAINNAATDATTNGVTSLFPSTAANTAPKSSLAFNQIDGIPAEYRISETGRHFHTHITVLDASGRRVALPEGIGMLGDPAQPLDPYPGYALDAFTAGGSIATYYLHTHDHSGFVHAEDDPTLDAKYNLNPPATYTLGNLLHIWGETADATHFTKYVTGPIHVYLSRIYVVRPTGPNDSVVELQTTPVEWKGDPLALPAVAADDFGQIPLESLGEITVEVGDVYHPVPRYYFPAYWCRSRASDGASDCTLDAAPANVQPGAVMRKPA